MKRSIVLLLTALTLLLTGCGGEPAPELPEGVLEGVLEGSARGYTGTITVHVTVEGTDILSIEVVEDEEVDVGREVYEVMIPAMVEADSTDVDVVTGATGTSSGLQAAVQKALDQA